MSQSDAEVLVLHKILQNQRLMKLVKFSLTNLIQKLINDIGFDKSSFFSDNIHRFGNIGHCDDDPDLQRKLDYILSPGSTIREKVSAITNSIVNGSDTQKKNKKNTKLLYEFIMSSSTINQKGLWICKRAKQINQFVLNGYFTQMDPTHFWAPIYLLYPGYRQKYDRTKTSLNGIDKFVPAIDGITEQDLFEPLSTFEKQFLERSGVHTFDGSSNTFTNHPVLPMITGRYIYKDIISMIPESETRDKSIIIGGISGHTILLLELALIVNIKWIPILFACIITQIPHHHSIAEIVDVLRELDILGQNEKDMSKDSSRYLNVPINLAKTIDISL